MRNFEKKKWQRQLAEQYGKAGGTLSRCELHAEWYSSQEEVLHLLKHQNKRERKGEGGRGVLDGTRQR